MLRRRVEKIELRHKWQIRDTFIHTNVENALSLLYNAHNSVDIHDHFEWDMMYDAINKLEDLKEGLEAIYKNRIFIK